MPNTGPNPESLNTHGFETERLTVEVPTKADADILYELVGGADRAEVCATLVWDGPDDVSDVLFWVEKAQDSSFADFGFAWVIRDRTGELTGTAGQAIGTVGIRPRGTPGRADVGYWLGRPYWGKGLMTEALAKLVDYGFTTLDYYKIEAEVLTNNEAGIRLVEKIGMTREGLIKQAYRKSGQFVDAAHYGLLRDDWNNP